MLLKQWTSFKIWKDWQIRIDNKAITIQCEKNETTKQIKWNGLAKKNKNKWKNKTNPTKKTSINIDFCLLVEYEWCYYCCCCFLGSRFYIILYRTFFHNKHYIPFCRIPCAFSFCCCYCYCWVEHIHMLYRCCWFSSNVSVCAVCFSTQHRMHI